MIVFERKFWTREVFFTLGIAAWMLVAYGCLTWWPKTLLCGAAAMLAAEWMIMEEE